MGRESGVAGRVSRGDVRLCRFSPPGKSRPVVILTRDRAVEYLASITVAPITSAIRGVPSEVVLNEEDGMKGPCAINLHNVITVRQSELGRRVTQLSAPRMREICEALRFALGCD
jgi:mRNA interferase MazF